MPTAIQSSSGATRLPVERRFPLGLSSDLATVRKLYDEGKTLNWEPLKDLDWKSLGAGDYDDATREAARAIWSRRAWTEYTALAETPALLIRFCLETDREVDPKYFLTVRNTEEAWHVECFHRLAEAFGGYLASPAQAAWEPVFNQRLYRVALDADRSLDEYVAVHCAVEDGLELALFEAYTENARNPLVRALLDKVLAAKRRHASFGWLYLEARAAELNEDRRQAIGRAVADWIERVAFAGYHLPSLSSSIDSTTEAAQAQRLAAAGLGATSAAEEEHLFSSYVARCRERLAELGIALPTLSHPRLGEL